MIYEAWREWTKRESSESIGRFLKLVLLIRTVGKYED